MSETKIVNDVKRGLYEIVNKYYDTLMADKTELNKNIYYKVLELYKKINKSKTISEIKGYLNEIKIEMNTLKEQYLSKVGIYENIDKNTQASEAAALMREINDITKLAQALNDTYSQTKGILSKYTSKKVKTSVADNKPQTSVSENKPKTIAQETPKKTINLEGVDFKNPIVNALHKLTGQIIDLKEKLAKIDSMSKDAITLRKKINELSDKRLDIANKLFGNDGINYIRNIESLETRFAHCNNTQIAESYEVDSNGYVQELEDLIYILGDLKFYVEESKYVNDRSKYDDIYLSYHDKFKNLVNSLYGEKNPVIYSYGDYNITVNDLISYLGVYNFRGGYQNFKEHHKTGKIGNEAISKEMYASGLDKITGFIDSFKNKSSDMIKSSGNKVVVKDSRETKDELRFQIDSKMVDLYKVICSKMQVKNTGVSL